MFTFHSYEKKTKKERLLIHSQNRYALARREMLDCASVAASNAIRLLENNKTTTATVIRAAALHVKSLCTGSMELQRESQILLLRHDLRVASVENVLNKLSCVLDNFDLGPSFCCDNDITLCALQSLEFASRYPEKGLKSLICVVSQLLDLKKPIHDCVVLSVLSRTLLLMRSHKRILLGQDVCFSLCERCISLWKKKCVWKKDDENKVQIDFRKLLYVAFERCIRS